MQTDPSLNVAKLECVSKSYGGLRVLEDFSFELEPGCVTALLGPNGAGKSTVAGLLTGRLSADVGQISLLGWTRAIAGRGPEWASCFNPLACLRR